MDHYKIHHITLLVLMTRHPILKITLLLFLTDQARVLVLGFWSFEWFTCHFLAIKFVTSLHWLNKVWKNTKKGMQILTNIIKKTCSDSFLVEKALLVRNCVTRTEGGARSACHCSLRVWGTAWGPQHNSWTVRPSPTNQLRKLVWKKLHLTKS
jgi:hypothetical protein